VREGIIERAATGDVGHIDLSASETPFVASKVLALAIRERLDGNNVEVNQILFKAIDVHRGRSGTGGRSRRRVPGTIKVKHRTGLELDSVVDVGQSHGVIEGGRLVGQDLFIDWRL
jgi:hypothetical protein